MSEDFVSKVRRSLKVQLGTTLSSCKTRGVRAADAVFILLSGDSPLLPEGERRGVDDVNLRVGQRASVAELVGQVAPAMFEHIEREPECGHYQILLSDRDGLVLLCAECELGVEVQGPDIIEA